MDRRKLWIPVGWTGNDLPGGRFSISLHSHTLVLQVPAMEPGFEVERIPGSWSPHVPEKKARYRVSWSTHRDNSITVEPVRLANAKGHVLVPLVARRPQTCLDLKGKLHGLYMVHNGNPYANCGEYLYMYRNARHDLFSPHVEPTCEACLAYQSVWNLFSIFPYEDKRVEEKRVAKIKAAEERHLRLPTAYARILDDDFLENPTYRVKKRVNVLDPSEIDETEDYDEHPRDRKRASAIDRNRRLEESKARVQGHRR